MQIELTQKDLEVIYTALGELPAKHTFDLIVKLQMQEHQEEAETKKQKAKDKK